MERQTVGQFISVLRKSKGYTQQALGAIIGVTGKTVSKWECDEGLPDIMTLPALAEALEVTIEELLSGKRMPAEENSQNAAPNKRSNVTLANIFKQKELKFHIMSIVSLGILALALLFEILFWSVSDLIVIFILFILFLLGGGVLYVIGLILLQNSTNVEDMEDLDYLKKLKQKRNGKIFNYSYAVGTVLLCIAVLIIAVMVQL